MKDNPFVGADVTDASCDVPQAKWATFTQGTRWNGKARVLTSGVDCDTLVRQ